MTVLLASADRETWLAARRKGVGASEGAIVLDDSPFGTPLGLYFEKRSEVPEWDPPDYVKWGLRIEPAIAQAYIETTGATDVQVPPKLMAHDAWPWMLASLDRIRSDRVVECKRVVKYKSNDFGPSGSEEIPSHYYCQVQQQMAVAGKQLADLAALIGECDFRIFTIPFNAQFVERLAEAEREFMRQVEDGEPPLPDFEHVSTYDLLRTMDPENGAFVALDMPEQLAVDRLESLQQRSKIIESGIKKIKSKLMHSMGKAEFGFLPDGRTVKRSKERFYIKKPKSRY